MNMVHTGQHVHIDIENPEDIKALQRALFRTPDKSDEHDPLWILLLATLLSSSVTLSLTYITLLLVGHFWNVGSELWQGACVLMAVSTTLNMVVHSVNAIRRVYK